MTGTFVFIAAFGYKALVLLYVWLLSAISAAALSRSKGYGEKPGLGTGLLTTILLVEQNANYALEVSNRGYVLETGTVALSDESGKLRENPEVQKAYLGT